MNLPSLLADTRVYYTSGGLVVVIAIILLFLLLPAPASGTPRGPGLLWTVLVILLILLILGLL